MDELTSEQVDMLLESDLYRENDFMDEEDQREMERKQRQAQSGSYSRGP